MPSTNIQEFICHHFWHCNFYRNESARIVLGPTQFIMPFRWLPNKPTYSRNQVHSNTTNNCHTNMKRLIESGWIFCSHVTCLLLVGTLCMCGIHFDHTQFSDGFENRIHLMSPYTHSTCAYFNKLHSQNCSCKRISSHASFVDVTSNTVCQNIYIYI